MLLSEKQFKMIRAKKEVYFDLSYEIPFAQFYLSNSINENKPLTDLMSPHLGDYQRQ